ncbi:WXG100 family type VII secretion target [Frankia sp. CNm7]|uniref:WXG100 family type VII secretion target n=1 Tax=Frankia nepalensis TaxID=1836974 RepID=A0A937RBU3_9ACTN|nr:WXG100 family type VII secretion target [Frankia nepalensis]MBL7496587.1 WXG100 family type VII secretion target [Frankia nepalensis]MBL7508806.1 WXG100 family type VII secretion target [Frankia nepalensis]MBL7520220.1 WXG100 family type VII secretion target [Frankia nepalensis]MBL7627560.1 WXG100 family type VII secretion target [Frankia nepalensis]
MANVHVDYEAIRGMATTLSRIQTDMENQLTALKGQIDALVTSGFITDQASGRFQTSYTQWDTGTRQAITGLGGMSKFLSETVTQHEQLDATLGQAAG